SYTRAGAAVGWTSSTSRAPAEFLGVGRFPATNLVEDRPDPTSSAIEKMRARGRSHAGFGKRRGAFAGSAAAGRLLCRAGAVSGSWIRLDTLVAREYKLRGFHHRTFLQMTADRTPDRIA